MKKLIWTVLIFSFGLVCGVLVEDYNRPFEIPNKRGKVNINCDFCGGRIDALVFTKAAEGCRIEVSNIDYRLNEE